MARIGEIGKVVRLVRRQISSITLLKQSETLLQRGGKQVILPLFTDVTLYGWRAGFFLTGTLSLLYFVVFWFAYRDPKESKQLSKEEYTYIEEGGAQQEGTAAGNPLANLGFLLRQPKAWGLTLGFTAYGYSFYLILTWLPGYLQTALHMTVLKSGFYTIVPWVVSTLTDILIGGWLVDALINSHSRSRYLVLSAPAW